MRKTAVLLAASILGSAGAGWGAEMQLSVSGEAEFDNNVRAERTSAGMTRAGIPTGSSGSCRSSGSSRTTGT